MTSNASTPAAPPLSGVILFLIVSATVLGLALLSRFNGFKIYDDAYMFVRYADHVLAGEGMVWNTGEGPVYGATSLAFVFAVIPFRLLMPENAAAAVFSASYFWGMVFLGLIFRLGLQVMRPSPAQKPYVIGLLMLSLIATAVSLRGHFASGMETTFVMAYLTGIISLLERQRQGQGRAWLTGAVLGLAWWIRPDLLILTVGIPAAMVVLAWANVERTAWLKVLGMSLAGAGLCLLGAFALTGAWLPLSFFAKSTGLYGPEFAAQYRLTPFAEGARFLARSWPPLVVIGLGLFLKWRRLRAGYAKLDLAVWIGILAYAIYFGFFVLQVMGFGQRFYYPLFPLLVYLALRDLLELGNSLRLGHGFEFQEVPGNLERIGLVVLAGLLLYYGFDYGRSLKLSRPGERFAVLDPVRIYREELKDYWAQLDALERLPDALRIATTEVGMPAALYPHRHLDDLAGLNAPALVRDGLNAQSILLHCPADLIYFPHAHYAQLSKSLTDSKEFAAAYITLPPTEVKAAMGVSIRKASPYAAELLHIFGR